MLFSTAARFHPRIPEDRARRRHEAALKAEVADLSVRLADIEKEQQTQLRRIAQLQAQLDEAITLIKSLKH